jgi:hypothetical protein
MQCCLKEKGARRRLLNLNRMIVDQAAINAGFDFRRDASKPMEAGYTTCIARFSCGPL